MIARALIVATLLVAAAGAIAQASRSEVTPIHLSFATFPMLIGEWRGRPSPPFTDDVLKVLGVDDYLTRAYFTNDAAAGLYIGYWASQRQGDAIHSPLNCLPGSGWEPVSKTPLTVAVADTPGGPSRDVTVNRYLVQKGLDRQLIVYWYQSHGRVIASEYASKFYLVRDAIGLNRTDASMVRVIVPVNPANGGEAAAEAQAIRFIKVLFPELPGYIPA